MRAHCRYLRVNDAGMETYGAAMYVPSISEAGGSSESSVVLPWTSFIRQVRALGSRTRLPAPRDSSKSNSTALTQVGFSLTTRATDNLQDAQLTGMTLCLLFQPGAFEFRIRSVMATRAPAFAGSPVSEVLAGLQDAQVLGIACLGLGSQRSTVIMLGVWAAHDL